jgi:hypothetical protein
METRDREETYRGHRLSVTAYEERPGWWSWTYLVDRDVVGKSARAAMLRDPDAALQRALAAAKVRADEMG